MPAHMPPRILLVITKGEAGGAQTHVAELCQAIGQRALFTAAIGGEGPSPLGDALTAQGVATTHLSSLSNSLNPLKLWSAVHALLGLIRAQQPHVIHAHSAVAGVIARIAGKISQTPVVYTVHGFGFKPQAPRLIRYNAWLAEALLAAWTTRMVCVSDFERQLARQLPMDPGRVSVVHNALADVPWLGQAEAEPARVVMVARMAAPKRPDLLLQALDLLAKQQPHQRPAVTLLGGGPALAAQQQRAHDLNLGHVHFAGDVPNVAERLAQHQIFVLLSDHEGLPISVLEAMRAGLAIVASRLPGIEELITDGQHGLLVPNEPQAIAQALQRLLGDAALRQRLGQAARQRYAQSFQPQAMADQLMAIYEEAPLLPTARWPMTLPRRHRAALASQHAQRQQTQLGWALLGTLVLALSWGLGWVLQQHGWATHDFGRTVLACAVPYAVAAHLLYRAAHLPAAERGSLLLVTTALPFVLTPLGFALLQQPYSRGAVLLTYGLTMLWFWLGDRWLMRQRAFKLLYWEDEQPAHMLRLMQALGSTHPQVPLQLIRWPGHWRQDAGLCPPALAVQGALTAPAQGHPSQAEQTLRRSILTQLKLHHIRLYSPQAVAEALTGRVPASTLESELWQPDGNPAYDLLKRVLDLTVVLALLPLWLPLGALVAIAVRIDSPGPALFSQWRVGLHGQPFRIFKFRSMRHEPVATAQFAQTNDPRITRFGQLMRRSRLDEIPQLWNVLKGDMSLIGPRPEQAKFVAQFAEQIASYPYRHLVRPGLTGWAQVQQGYAASAEETVVKLSYDLYYVTHYSLAMDLLIALKTCAPSSPAMARGKAMQRRALLLSEEQGSGGILTTLGWLRQELTGRDWAIEQVGVRTGRPPWLALVHQARQADVLIASNNFQPAYWAVLLGLLTHRPAVVWVHGPLAEVLQHQPPSAAKKGFLQGVYNLADALVFASQASMDSFARAMPGVRQPFRRVVHNPAHAPASTPDPAPSTPQPFSSALWAASPRKRPELLLHTLITDCHREAETAKAHRG